MFPLDRWRSRDGISVAESVRVKRISIVRNVACPWTGASDAYGLRCVSACQQRRAGLPAFLGLLVIALPFWQVRTGFIHSQVPQVDDEPRANDVEYAVDDVGCADSGDIFRGAGIGAEAGGEREGGEAET